MQPFKLNDKALCWIPLHEIESSAVRQIENISELPFIWKHLAIMPDVHYGKGATIGTVLPTEGAIVPAAVGVDLGCGMAAAQTSLKSDQLPLDLSEIRAEIEQAIPCGKGKGNKKPLPVLRHHLINLQSKAAANGRTGFYDNLVPKWRNQFGSLGSGNHFIEIVTEETETVWYLIHSGSRGIGARLASFHMRVARELMDKWFIQLPDPDLAYLVEGTPAFDEYITDLNWCQKYAYRNRLEMLERVDKVVRQHASVPFHVTQYVDAHHNYTERENHFGKNIWVTRKGAIRARRDDYGLIPGSMGAKSYLVRGKGNVASLHSAPHGAGRAMSRRKARDTFTMEDFDQEMAGIEIKRSSKFLDEMPGAYKDIDGVMERAAGLVDIVHTFRQIVNVKGT